MLVIASLLRLFDTDPQNNVKVDRAKYKFEHAQSFILDFLTHSCDTVVDGYASMDPENAPVKVKNVLIY